MVHWIMDMEGSMEGKFGSVHDMSPYMACLLTIDVQPLTIIIHGSSKIERA